MSNLDITHQAKTMIGSPSIRSAILTTVLCAVSLIPLTKANASDTTERLRIAVARMNDWLATSDDVQAWREYLDLNILDAQAAKGPQADRSTLAQLLATMDVQDDALKHPVFEEVRRAMKAHIAQIDRASSGDLVSLQFAAREALRNYRKPTKEKIQYDLDVAAYELEMLRNVYRRDLDSRTRALIFHKLQLSETLSALGELEIEFPPEVSLGKMRSMISDELRRRSEIVDKIDALPLDIDDDDEEQDEESDLDDELDLSPPEPDDDEEDDLESLEEQRKTIENRIRELRKKFNEIRREDLPRLRRVRDGTETLQMARQRFKQLARERFDAAFTSAFQSIDRAADSFEFGTDDNIQQEFIDNITELADLIPTLANSTDHRSHAKLGSILLWLEQRQQLRDLCFAIRRWHSSPNAYVAVSSGLIQSITSQVGNETDRINEDFLGRIAKGWSYTNTSVSAFPVDDPNQAHLRIMLSGSATTDTYVRERSFRINSSSCGYLSAQRDIFAGLNGLFATQSQADASISSQYGGISTEIDFIRRLAAENFAKEKGRTDQEASRRARSRLLDRFDSETSSVVGGGMDQVEELSAQFRKYIGLAPAVHLRSFFDRVEAVAKKETRSAIAASTMPEFKTAGTDIQLKIHDSMLSNYIDPLFAGKSFTKDDLENEIKSIAGDDSDLFSAGTDDAEEVEDFKISFSDVRPIQIVFADNRVSAIITGTKFEQGDNAITTTLKIKVSFKVITRNGKLFMRLDGNPEIELAEDEKPDAESVAFAKILERKLTEAAEASRGEGFELPPNLIPPVEMLEDVEFVKSLQLGLLETNNGWLYLGWNYGGGAISTPAIWNEVVIENFSEQYRLNENQDGDSEVQTEAILTLPIESDEAASYDLELQ